MAGPSQVGADGGRAVVTVCDEPLARGGGQWRGLARSGLVQIGCAGGHFDMVGFAVGGLAGWPRRLSRSCHKRCETWWDGSRCAETISEDQREGRDGLGRVTMVSR